VKKLTLYVENFLRAPMLLYCTCLADSFECPTHCSLAGVKMLLECDDSVSFDGVKAVIVVTLKQLDGMHKMTAEFIPV